MRNATVIISSESRILMMLANHHASPFGKRTCKSRPKLGMESCPLLAPRALPRVRSLQPQAWHGIVPPVGTVVNGLGNFWKIPSLAWNRAPCWHGGTKAYSFEDIEAKLGMESCPLLAPHGLHALLECTGLQAWHGIVPPVGTAERPTSMKACLDQDWHGIVPPVGTGIHHRLYSRFRRPSLAWNRAPCWHSRRQYA